MKNYRINFIDGYSLKYIVFETQAADVNQAKSALFERYGPNFEHVIMNIVENEVLIYER